MNSGKTRWLCADIIRRCLDFPGSQAGIVRRNMPSLKRSTLRTFLQLVDDRLVKRFNQQDMYVEFKNGSVVFFMEANEQKDPEFYKFGGVELTFLGIDEAQEVSEKALLALLPKMRHVPRGYKHIEDLPPNTIRVNLTANPAPGWLKEKFVDRRESEDSIYIPATVFDNPYAPKDWVKKQKELFGFNETLFRRFVLGDWSVVYDEDAWVLIEPRWFEDAIIDLNEADYFDSENDDTEIWVGVDIARVKDKCVFAYVQGKRLIKFDIYENVRIPEIVDIIKSKIINEGIPPDHFAIDAIGVGAGVIDSLESQGYNVNPFFAGKKPIAVSEVEEEMGKEFVEFPNLRAQAYWYLRKKFQNGEIEISASIPEIELLKNEAISTRYKIVGEKTIQIEDKEKIRSRLGRSPDFLDALMMAVFCKHLQNEIKGLVLL